MKLLVTGTLSSLVHTTFAASAADWRSRSIYQDFTDRFARTDGSTDAPCDVSKNVYCGGTWSGITSKLDYIRNMGFTALWISPITAQVPNAYHGYYQTDLYSVNSEFGSADDLKNLVSAVHAKGMYLMLDIVPNHMAYPGCPDKVDYASFNVMGQPSHFHAFCPLQNMQNQTEVEHCWLGNCNMAMPDLKTDDEQVANELNYWVKQRVSRTTL